MVYHNLQSQSKALHALENSIGSHDIHCLYGQPQVGKTTIIKKFFDDNKQYVHVYINCDDILSASDLYIKITKDLNRQLVKNEKKMKLPDKMMGTEEFCDRIDEFSSLTNSKGLTNREIKIIVTLDNLDHWKKTFIQDSIIVLSEIGSIGLVLISDQSIYDLTDHMKSTSTRSQIQDRTLNIQILPWELNEIVDVILQDQPKKHKALYETFVKLSVSLIYRNRTKNFVTIKNYCQSQFLAFIEYYQSELHKKNDEKIPKMTSEELDEYYLKKFRPKVQMLVSQFLEPSKIKKKSEADEESLWLKKDQEIAWSMGKLITAVYVAAFTKPSDDKRNFVRYQKKFKSRKTMVQLEEEEVASKTFTMERVIQIYRSLMDQSKFSDKADQDENSDGTNDATADQELLFDAVFSDLQFLEDIKMIQIYSGDGLDSMTRFKIGNHVTREYVERIAKQVELSLDRIYGLS